MTKTKLYELLSERLASTNLSQEQLNQVRRIIADVICESLDEDIDRLMMNQIKMKRELLFSNN